MGKGAPGDEYQVFLSNFLQTDGGDKLREYKRPKTL